MEHYVKATLVLLVLVGLLLGCAPATETPPAPTAEPALPTSTPEQVAAATSTPKPPTATPTPEPPTATPTPEPPTATSTPEPPTATSTPEPPTVTGTPTLAPSDTSTPEPQPEPAVLTGRIFFPVFDEEAEIYNIFSAKVDGSDRQLVATEASQPALNSDGQRIAFRSWKADNRGLFERAVDGGDTWRFDVHFEAARPSFSPDDRYFLFQSREGGEYFAIYRTIDLEHKVLRRETFPIEGEAPVFTPDGQSFVYKGWLGSDNGLIWSNLDGSSPRQLTNELSDTNPAISPDGQSIVFMSQASGNWDIYLMGIDGSRRQQLTVDPAPDGLPTWSPDGKAIAFVSQRSGEDAIWVMPAPGTQEQVDANGDDQRLLFALEGPIDGLVKVDVLNSRGWIEETIDWAP
jgi:Tol biopolymer transport system component